MTIFDDARTEGNRLIALAASQAVNISEQQATIAGLEATVAQLRAEIEELSGIVVPPGADLQAALRDAPEGATLRLSGTYRGKNITPRSGQTLVGPAALVPVGPVGEDDDGFRCKSSGVAIDVTFVDLDVSGFGRHGIGCWIGTTVRGGRLHHNGKDGVGGDLEGKPSRILVENVELDHNGSAAWLGRGSAGAKFFHSHGVEVRDCNVHDNIGNGVWCDAQCGDWIVDGCVITGNTRKGVFYEKCGRSDGSFLGRDYAVYEGFATITNNQIINNNLDNQDNANPGVALYNSVNVTVEANEFSGNGNAVIVRNDPARLTDDKHGWVPDNITIRNNTLGGDRLIGCDLNGVTCENNA